MKKGSITLTWSLIVVLAGLLGALVSESTASAQEAVVRFYFFYSENCDDCQAIKDEFLPILVTQYGDQIEINYLDVSDSTVLEQRMTLEKRHGMAPKEADTSQVYIGDQALGGADVRLEVEVIAVLPD